MSGRCYKQNGYALVPMCLYFSGNFVKLELGIGKGKKLYDKRESIKERDLNREQRQALKGRNR